MTIGEFFNALLAVINAMSPYLLLGFLIAGILHVFVPKTFYAKYLSRDNNLGYADKPILLQACQIHMPGMP